MASKWEKVKYVSRVRPDSDDGRTDECNDSLDNIDVRFNGEFSAQATGQRFNYHVHQERPSLHHSQPILKANSYDCLRLSVPQDIGRRNSHESDTDGASRKRTSSVFSLLNGHEIDGDLPKRSQSFLKDNRRVLVKELFAKHLHDDGKSYRLKVSRSSVYEQTLKSTNRVLSFWL